VIRFMVVSEVSLTVLICTTRSRLNVYQA
jgi:hypothetical protein